MSPLLLALWLGLFVVLLVLMLYCVWPVVPGAAVLNLYVHAQQAFVIGFVHLLFACLIPPSLSLSSRRRRSNSSSLRRRLVASCSGGVL